MIYPFIFIFLIAIRFARVKHFYVITLVFLYVFSAFRLEVGCDWAGYLNQYKQYEYKSLIDAAHDREPIWSLIFIVQHRLGIPYQWINVLTSSIFFYGIHILARRQPNPLAFLVIMFPVLIINMPMSGIRQGAAIGIVCIAFSSFIDRRLMRYVLLIVFASGIHSSALIFLLLAPLVRGEYSWNRVVLAFLLAIPGGIALMATENANIATSRYLNTGLDAAGAVFRVALLAMSGLLYFGLLRRRWAGIFPIDYKLVSIGSASMLLLIFLVLVSSVIGDRLSYYFVAIQSIIYARLPYLAFRRSRVLLIIAPYIGLLVFFSVWVASSDHFAACYIPYRTWLFDFSGIRYD